MVHGLGKFKAYFGNHTNQYVFIGGTACAILMDELGASFRATKDLDIVLIIEALDPTFPKMIELFSKLPSHLELKFDTGLTPIHIDESIVSLSAILLNETYYTLLVKGKRLVDGYSLIEIETVILFKIKAWLDMNERKKAGETIDMKNIKKHKNDVFRLLANVSPASRIQPAGEVQNDVIQFIEHMKEERLDLKGLGISGTTLDEMLELLGNITTVSQ